VPIGEAGIEGVGIEVDTFRVLLSIDDDRQGHDLDAVSLRELRRQLRVAVGDEADAHRTATRGAVTNL
jgi:hypothetical protein